MSDVALPTEHEVEKKAQQFADAMKNTTHIVEADLSHIKINGNPLFTGNETDKPTADLNAAIKQFQAAIGIHDDGPKHNGVVGEKTLDALNIIGDLSMAADRAHDINSRPKDPKDKEPAFTVNRALDSMDPEGYGARTVEGLSKELKQLTGHDVDLAKFGITDGASVEGHKGSVDAVAANAKGGRVHGGHDGPG